MPKAALSREIVVRAAYDVAAKVGFDRFTVADVARHLGVSVPNIYKHASGLDGLRRSIAIAATRELTSAATHAAVGKSGSEAFLAMAAAYRTFAIEHSGIYPATQVVPAADDSEHLQVAESAVAMLAAVLRGYGLSDDRQIDAVRTVRSLLHGYVALEIAGGFEMPQDVDESFRYAVRLLDKGLSASSQKRRRAG
ncbi:TetR family transcriptional regulator [Antricoccus suffuscus]|uniref:TetR family transcriptional regulator n=1 Tax=Antricoccus suffuscus TaxID=1629062 RepID=A0A2T1A744_9ACTN|nr:TetR/AcrR family transcriptional regulator [Antricoccus suffuscus]PRZ44410.1 TetR family transcriptional regulator [Antricoccus suffuscus]